MEIQENAVWVGGLTPLHLTAAAVGYTGLTAALVFLLNSAQTICQEAQDRYFKELQCDLNWKDECLPLKKAQDLNCYEILQGKKQAGAVAVVAVGYFSGLACLAQIADPLIWNRLRIALHPGLY